LQGANNHFTEKKKYRVRFEVFAATELNEVFSGGQPESMAMKSLLTRLIA
jgi:hypothetical protein